MTFNYVYLESQLLMLICNTWKDNNNFLYPLQKRNEEASQWLALEQAYITDSESIENSPRSFNLSHEKCWDSHQLKRLF